MAPQGGSVWDHKSDKDLLLAIIDEGSLKWPTISEKMVAKGYTFTKEACRQHFQKIRKEARSGSSNDGGSSPVRGNPKVSKPVSNKSTPRKSKTMADSFATSNGSISTNNGSFAVNAYGHGNDYHEDGDEEMTTPAKRKRVMKMDWEGQGAPLCKIEGQSGERKPVDLENDHLDYANEDHYA